MGDWAKGEFSSAKQVAGKDYGCFAGFASNVPYVLAGDVFVFPKTSNASAIKAQQLLATTFMTPMTQVAFNNKKGSIPIRTDVDTSQMDLCAQAGVAALKDPSRHLAAPDMLTTPDMYGAVQDVISKFWNSGQSVDDAVKALQRTLKP
jgi:glucose/mannose transport system substrate-binding protein